MELFFDLVFVFTITQVTTVLAQSQTWKGLGQVALLPGIIFWMYGGYAWLTNSVALDSTLRRLTLLGGMAGFLVMALAVPDAFHGEGGVFGGAYVIVVLIHFGMFAKASRMSVVQAIRRLLPINVATALLVLVGGLIGGSAQYVLWTVAFVGEWVSPKLIDDSGFVIEAGHFVERHGLVVLIAIGESVVAVGIAAAGLRVDAQLIIIASTGLALSACLWWTHFGGKESAAERAMASAPVASRPGLAITAFGYCHLLLLLGVVAVAVGLKAATRHPFDALPTADAVALAGGAGVFLLGEALFRRTLRLDKAPACLDIAVVAVATIPLGRAAAIAELAALVVVFLAMLASGH